VSEIGQEVRLRGGAALLIRFTCCCKSKILNGLLGMSALDWPPACHSFLANPPANTRMLTDSSRNLPDSQLPVRLRRFGSLNR
jgi:hypothetical protein